VRQGLHEDLRLLLRTDFDRLGHESFRFSDYLAGPRRRLNVKSAALQ
jgi:hypothetical protein